MSTRFDEARCPGDSVAAVGAQTAQTWNRGCACRTLDARRLQFEIDRDDALAGLAATLRRTHPHLFAATAVFISRAVADALQTVVATLERVIARPGYRTRALARAPAIAARDFGPLGVFTSYDFHLTDDGPRLIEINTNAGGALLNAVLARAQRACCAGMAAAGGIGPGQPPPEEAFIAMFRAEWRRQRGGAPLRRLLIVDDEPATQHLAAEFELFRRMFRAHGIDAAIADAARLEDAGGRLVFDGVATDLVYSRLTDFHLDEPRHAALRRVYEAGGVVLTPHPRAHALYADKRNLVALSDGALLESWRVAAADRALLAATVPHTRLVTAENAGALWAARRTLFFKPFAGYAARAAYRGDKLTRRVWNEITAGGYVAQALVPPTERLIHVDGAAAHLKFDLRAYTYEGRTQLLAARLYSGQTTNLRTPGGGFAPVVVLES